MQGKEESWNTNNEKELVRRLTRLAFGHLLDNPSIEIKAILKAVVSVAVGAMKEAQEKGVDVYGEEDGWLVKISPSGKIEKIRQLTTRRRKITQREYTIS